MQLSGIDPDIHTALIEFLSLEKVTDRHSAFLWFFFVYVPARYQQFITQQDSTCSEKRLFKSALSVSAKAKFKEEIQNPKSIEPKLLIFKPMIECQTTSEKSCDSLKEEQFMVRLEFGFIIWIFLYLRVYVQLFLEYAILAYCIENSWFSVWTVPTDYFDLDVCFERHS